MRSDRRAALLMGGILCLLSPSVLAGPTPVAVVFVARIPSGPPEGPVKSTGMTDIMLNDDKHKTSMWKNLFSYYKKTREWAKTYVTAVNAVSDLLYSTYAMLKKWEDISKKAEWLMSNNPFEGEGVVDRVENAENWFRTSDELLFVDVPSAMKQRQMLSAQKEALIASFRAGGDATVGSGAAQAYSESYQEGYLKERGLRPSPGKDGRAFLTPEEVMLQQLIAQNAHDMAEQHQQTMLLQQEDAANQAVAMDVYEMANCLDDNICGGMTERSDAENRMGMMDQRRAILAKRQGEASTKVLLQDLLSATQTYVSQGVMTTAYLGGLIRFQKDLCEANGMTDAIVSMPSYKWEALYPSAYSYNGKVYGPDVHYYDLYK